MRCLGDLIWEPRMRVLGIEGIVLSMDEVDLDVAVDANLNVNQVLTEFVKENEVCTKSGKLSYYACARAANRIKDAHTLPIFKDKSIFPRELGIL